MSDTLPSPLQTFSAALADIVAAAAPSVVSVHSARSRSSGFAWRSNLIVTADEALAEEGEVAVTVAGGERHPATIVGRDASTDIALLRVAGATLSPMTFGARLVRAGELALTISGGALAASGIVAIAGPSWHSMRGGEIDARIELDVRLRREAEGGLALDAAVTPLVWRCSGLAGVPSSFQNRRSPASPPASSVTAVFPVATLASGFNPFGSRATAPQARWS